jgi:class 3 adenylate cyclase
MRAIVFTDLAGSVEQTSRLGDDGHLEVLRVHNKIVRDALADNGGREVKHTGDGIMAAFSSVASAVAFAIAAQRAFRDHNRSSAVPVDVKIGISAGEPVTDDSDDLFGAAVQLAARLCGSASAGEIVASVAVRELSAGKRFPSKTAASCSSRDCQNSSLRIACVGATMTSSAPRRRALLSLRPSQFAKRCARVSIVRADWWRQYERG